jgi:hypothetical protein
VSGVCKMNNNFKLTPKTLTVIIKNIAPLIFEENPPTYRSVHIELTEDQRIKLGYVGTNCGNEIFEDVSQCFLEDLEQ